MNATFRIGKQYKLRQVPFKDIMVTYQSANGHGLAATRFYFKYASGVSLVLRRGKIVPEFIQTRRCLEGNNKRLRIA